ncbi:MAG: hypothetical protein AAFR84_02335 [Pseudomonadota bacterium]
MIGRDEIVATALAFNGVPFRHGGRDRAGLDCVGLPIAVARELGAVPKDLDAAPYPRDPDGTLLARMRAAGLRPRGSRPALGSVLVFCFPPGPARHVGIVVSVNPLDVIHADNGRGRVVVLRLGMPGARRSFPLTAFDFAEVGE